MNMQFFEQMNDFNRNLYKPMSQLGQLTMQTAEAYTRQSINAGNEIFSLCADYAQNLPNNIKKPEDAINLQAKLWNELSNKCMNNLNELFETQQNAAAAYLDLFKQNMKSVSEEAARATKSTKTGRAE